ncbi:hypothetical protein GCM10027160_34510 [Streptomyces calidiresistens]|uniref:Uncharacterized protein n=1 Tax=Streptomyces calidiresistens TaxID=1485586 RepID=A0A7W3XUT0_9ACTN|nr:hypothetical protein [Streptomyces calidiresistens]MBB0228036.1 hypothetical protein [Streptomyces calidiresistens]
MTAGTDPHRGWHGAASAVWGSWFLFSLIMAGAAVRGGGFPDQGVNRLHWSLVLAHTVWVVLQFVPGERGAGRDGAEADPSGGVPDRRERLVRCLSMVVQSVLLMSVITAVGTLVTGRKPGVVLSAVLGASWMIPYLIGTLLLAVCCLLSPVRIGGRPRARRTPVPAP